MNRNLLPLSLAMALLLSACGDQQTGTANGSRNGAGANASVQQPQAVTGPAIRATIETGLPGQLPAGLSLVLRLLDTTDAANLPVVVTESVSPISGPATFEAALGYDPSKIDAERSYGFQVSLMAETLVLSGTERPVPVLTQGAPTENLKIALVRGGQPSANIPPAELAKQELAKLDSAIGGMRRIHGSSLNGEISTGWDAFVEGEGKEDPIRMAREQTEVPKEGKTEYRYAYRDDGAPWLVERSYRGEVTLIAWDEQNNLVLNEKGKDEKASEEEIAALRSRAEKMHGTAAAKR